MFFHLQFVLRSLPNTIGPIAPSTYMPVLSNLISIDMCAYLELIETNKLPIFLLLRSHVLKSLTKVTFKGF